MVTGGKGGGRGIVREFGIDNVHNAIFKINNQQGKKKKERKHSSLHNSVSFL